MSKKIMGHPVVIAPQNKTQNNTFTQTPYTTVCLLKADEMMQMRHGSYCNAPSSAQSLTGSSFTPAGILPLLPGPSPSDLNTEAGKLGPKNSNSKYYST